MREIVNGNAAEKEITLSFLINASVPYTTSGLITRLADPTPDCPTSFTPSTCSSYFGMTTSTAFAYTTTGTFGTGLGDGLELSARDFNVFGYAGISPVLDNSLACSSGGTPFYGTGMMSSTVKFSNKKNTTITFRYRML